MNCRGCRIAKEMVETRFVCGIFAWKCTFCPTCREAIFDGPIHRWGWRLTRNLFDGEVWSIEHVEQG
jgi:hypothetical protein